ncbi:ATP-binding protein [Natrialba asiatica]|uniref:Chemotaxis protein CheA n=1 Tax=Natrialba asiatica (strain ATCC 700177 / DSM 12278 / JCM 9576 / FERM P-10747 / NBRC 102637 / 172P1) TaxID=29540 RepID=M0APR0_NATA1|nr:ATP-binding protein [Natrialba asiatica]ELZ00495.1 CheA signal transduction histidine kinase [Natrialba asiatica DSM 12278]
MTDYWSDFVRESEDRITELNNALLTLERNPDDEAAMDKIFRIAHTLKGNCGAAGLESASNLAHAIEDVLDAVRRNRLTVSPELMDAIFDAVDELERMVEEVALEGEIETDPSATIDSLRAQLEPTAETDGLSSPSTAEIERILSHFEPPADDNHSAYLARIEVADDGAKDDHEEIDNGILVVEALIDAFDLIGTDPDRSTIADGAYGTTFDAVFGSAVGKGAIASGLDPVGEVADFELVDVTTQFEDLVADREETADTTTAEPGSQLSADEAQELEVDDLLDEFTEFDDLDEKVEEVDDSDLDVFDDMGDAGAFDDLLADADADVDDLDLGSPAPSEPSATADAGVSTGADPEPANGSTETDASDTADDSTTATETEQASATAAPDESDDVDDAEAVFAELKDEVDTVGFDELQEELAELEFDEFDQEDEVGMDELLGDAADADEPFLAGDSLNADEVESVSDAELDELVVADDASVSADDDGGETLASDAVGEESAGTDEPADAQERETDAGGVAESASASGSAATSGSASECDAESDPETDAADGLAESAESTESPEEAAESVADDTFEFDSETSVETDGADDTAPETASAFEFESDAESTAATTQESATESETTAETDTDPLNGSSIDDSETAAWFDETDEADETVEPDEAASPATDDPGVDADNASAVDAESADRTQKSDAGIESNAEGDTGEFSEADRGGELESDSTVSTPTDDSTDETVASEEDERIESGVETAATEADDTADTTATTGFDAEDSDASAFDESEPVAEASGFDSQSGSTTPEFEPADADSDTTDIESGSDEEAGGDDEFSEVETDFDPAVTDDDVAFDDIDRADAADAEAFTSGLDTEVDDHSSTSRTETPAESALGSDSATDDLDGFDGFDDDAFADLDESLESEPQTFESDFDSAAAVGTDSGFETTPESSADGSDGGAVSSGESSATDSPRIDEPNLEIPEITVPETVERPDTDRETDEIQSVRVDVEQIDELLTLVEGLVTSRVRLRHEVESGQFGQSVADAGAITDELDDLEDLTTDLQETVMDVRLVPLRTVANRLPRVVRDIARDQGKTVAFEMSGEDVELDRSILDRLRDPLIHLVRNAVDHGIESPEERDAADKPEEGTVEVSASRSRDRVVITVSDDGSGLDPERLRSEAIEEGVLSADDAAELDDESVADLVFHPGFSTTEEVTDVSGRGVGMDVVKRTIEDLDGSVSIETDPSEGTTVTMSVPVSIAIDDVLFVESGGEEFGIPTKAVSDIVPVELVEEVDGEAVLLDSAGSSESDRGVEVESGAGDGAVEADGDDVGSNDDTDATATDDDDTDERTQERGTPVIRLGEELGVIDESAAGSETDTSASTETSAGSAPDTATTGTRSGLAATGSRDDRPGPRSPARGMVVRIRENVRPIALRCDAVYGQQEVVVKPFEGFMANLPGLSGATVRGRGKIVNILDVTTL